MIRLLFVAWNILATAAGAIEPQRIVSLAPSMTETVFALGLGERLVGVTTYCDYPPEALKIDRVGTFLVANVEQILVRRPDVVLAVPSPGNRGSVEKLQELGIRVVLADPGSVREIESAIRVLGRELGRKAEADALIAGIQDRIARVHARVAGRNAPRTLIIVGHTPLMAAGKGTFPDELIRSAGGVNLAAEAGTSWPHLSAEFVLAAAPDVIIDTTMGPNALDGKEEVAADFWADFKNIPAVRDGRVYHDGTYMLLRPGPRVGDAIEKLAGYLHPLSD